MTVVLLRLNVGSSETDVRVEFDDQTTVGQLADAIEHRLDRPGGTPRTLERQTRSVTWFARSARIAQCDLRSGDVVALALDTGLRATESVAASAIMRIVAGPDPGRTFEVRRGDSQIGRSNTCDITLRDDMASRRHATIRVSDIVEILDAGSTNGIEVNGTLISGVQRVRPGDMILVGETMLTVDLLAGASDGADARANRVEFNRPPRMDTPFQGIEIELPAPPDRPSKQRLPMVSALVPLLMGAGLYFVTRSVLTLAFLAMSPVMVVGSWYENKRSGRKDHVERLNDHAELLAELTAKLEQAREAEVASRFASSPAPTELLAHVNELSERLWERQPEDPDFLHLRVGVAAQPTRTTVTLAQGGARQARAELAALADSFADLPPVPLVVDARTNTPVGVAGSLTAVNSAARSLIAQAAALHSPDELCIAAMIGEADLEEWAWIKWLPHAAGERSSYGKSIAVGADESIELVSGLGDLLEARLAQPSLSGPAIFEPHIVLLITNHLELERSRLSRLLDRGAEAGITIIWLEESSRRLPKACRTVIEIEPGDATLTCLGIDAGSRAASVPLEGLGVQQCDLVARALAPVIDVSADAGREASIPSVVPLVDLLGGLEILDGSTAIAERWTQSGSRLHLRAPIGASELGPLMIDIRHDGPHGLVGGTTGAGKSEFLQSLIVSLAASHSPERINFLLVDYKGGAAFAECQHLIHTVGLITDLTPALVQRSLVSLRAELHRREVLLNEARSKDLLEMERSQHPDTPPSLLIIVDEFAALANEVPEFVEGIVDIAQRGRSLGMHLLLATQRPAGVITPQIKANTNLRVALRMASEDESTDVVAAPDAARIDRSSPGRGVIRRGPSDLVTFQSAYVGGTTTSQQVSTLAIADFDLCEINHWAIEQSKHVGPDKAAPTDLTRLVQTINNAAVEGEASKPRRPWLEPLPPHIDLMELPRPISDSEVPIGLVDSPEKQTRRVVVIDFDRVGSLLIYGTGGAGKTVALRTLAASTGLTPTNQPFHVHALDFAGRGLTPIEELPHVGSVIGSGRYEQTVRLFEMLQRMIVERSELFSQTGAASLSEYRGRSGDELPRVAVLIDGYDNFVDEYERIDRGKWLDAIPRLVADGRQVGLHFAMTGARRNSFPSSITSAAQGRVIMRLATDDDYYSLNVDPRLIDSKAPAGRCAMEGSSVQIAMVGSSATTENEKVTLQRLGVALARSGRSFAPSIQPLGTAIPLSTLPTSSERALFVVDADHEAFGPDFTRNVLIAGPAGSGKTTALLSLIQASAATRLTMKACYSATPPEGWRSFEQLEQDLQAGELGGATIAIDGAERLVGHGASYALERCLSAEQPPLLLLACDSATARGFDPLFRAIRERADVIALQPDQAMDADLVRSPIPPRAGRPPAGRGYSTLTDVLVPIQVALPSAVTN